MRATIDRYKLSTRTGSGGYASRYPWRWGYTLTIEGQDYAQGTQPLASVRAFARRKGATEIVETWKVPATPTR